MFVNQQMQPNYYVYRIELVTMQDVMEFVNQAGEVKTPVLLTDGNGFCVSGKSLLGAIASVEWGSLYCEAEEDIYGRIQRFVKEES